MPGPSPVFLNFQKINFTPNCMFRIGSAFPYAVELIRPASGRRFPGVPISEFGLPRLTVLKRFTNSKRSSSRLVPPKSKCLKNETSARQ